LHFEADVPDCDLGKRAQALIANGTYTGCSFEFWPKDYTTTERRGADGKTEYVIRHTAFKKIDALTIAMKPAYSQTSVGLREAMEGENQAEQLREAQQAAEREYNHRKRLLQMKNL
jgi:phage head maturation protease